MLEELDDTEPKSARLPRPAWPDASVGADAAARNGLRTSPFSLCGSKNQRARERRAPEGVIKKPASAAFFFFLQKKCGRGGGVSPSL